MSDKSVLTQNRNDTKFVGALGEKIASKYLIGHGYRVLERNYWKSWGEIDIVAHETTKKVPRETHCIHFIEVKTVTHETKLNLYNSVAHETWRPEELVHQFKLHQVSRAAETWLAEKKCNLAWQIDVIAVRVVPHEKFATVNLILNVS